MASTPPRVSPMRSASTTSARTRRAVKAAPLIPQGLVPPAENELPANLSESATLSEAAASEGETPASAETPSVAAAPVAIEPISPAPVPIPEAAPAAAALPLEPPVVKRGRGRPRKIVPPAEALAPATAPVMIETKPPTVAPPRVVAKAAKPVSPFIKPGTPAVPPSVVVPDLPVAAGAAPVANGSAPPTPPAVGSMAVAALIDGNKAVATGFEALSKIVLEESRAAMARAASTASAMLAARNLQEVIRLQTAHHLDQMTLMMAAGARLGQMTADLMKAGGGPLHTAHSRPAKAS